MKIAKELALPVREQNGQLEELGSFTSLLEAKDDVRIGKSGVTVIGANGSSYFCRFSNGVKKGIAAGDITPESLGNLVVYVSTYADEQGEEQKRMVLGVPQGVFSTSISGTDIQKAAKANQFKQRSISLADVKLTDLVA
jgi:hypothetical protein